jgi:hypothetical protein
MAASNPRTAQRAAASAPHAATAHEPSPLLMEGTNVTSSCPAWCGGFHSPLLAGTADDAHVGDFGEVPLTLADPFEADLPDFLSVQVWQHTSDDGPSVGVFRFHGRDDLPDMTFDEAEALATALLKAVRAGRSARTGPIPEGAR